MINITFLGAFQPRDPIDQWLKPFGKCDVVHHIIWAGGGKLRTGCQQTIDAASAVRPVLGAKMCELCWTNYRERKKALNAKRH